jgi:hypothetical protein
MTKTYHTVKINGVEYAFFNDFYNRCALFKKLEGSPDQEKSFTLEGMSVESLTRFVSIFNLTYDYHPHVTIQDAFHLLTFMDYFGVNTEDVDKSSHLFNLLDLDIEEEGNVYDELKVLLSNKDSPYWSSVFDCYLRGLVMDRYCSSTRDDIKENSVKMLQDLKVPYKSLVVGDDDNTLKILLLVIYYTSNLLEK